VCVCVHYLRFEGGATTVVNKRSWLLMMRDSKGRANPIRKAILGEEVSVVRYGT
jgi:hypothetical protein